MPTQSTGAMQGTSSWTKTNDDSTISTPTDRGNLSSNIQMVAGTGAGQINAIYRERATISAAGTLSLDLTALTGSLGEGILFTNVKAVDIYNRSDEELTIGGNAANFPMLAVSEVIKMGKRWAAASPSVFKNTSFDGWTITDTTADKLDITNDGAADAEVDVVIYGVATIT